MAGFPQGSAPTQAQVLTALGTTANLTVTSLTAAGTSTATGAAVTTPVVSSGAAFIPSATLDTMVYIPIAATTTGTVKITYGPSTGAENTPVPTSNLVALSEPAFTLRVPAGWKVVVTIVGTTVAIGTVTVTTC